MGKMELNFCGQGYTFGSKCVIICNWYEESMKRLEK